MTTNFDDGNSLFKFVVRDGNGVKGMVDAGILKVPERYIQPPKERIKKLDACIHDNTPIDLSKLEGSRRYETVEAIVRAAETVGFFQVVNHGVPLELLESLKDTAHRFFAQPPEKKAMYLKGVSSSPLVKYGTSFVPEKEKSLEWRDHISMVYSDDAHALQYWPKECRELALEYLKKATWTVRKILQVLLEKLDVVADESTIDALVGLRKVNMNIYPTCPNPELTVGVGRHSDLGTLTVLLQDGIGGLQVRVEENKDIGIKAEWIEVVPIPGALIINVGDTLQVLSNGRYRSAEHRVRTTSSKCRVSVPMFTYPRPKDKIGPLPQFVKKDGVVRYREFVFEDYMKHFYGNPHEGKKALDFATINYS